MFHDAGSELCIACSEVVGAVPLRSVTLNTHDYVESLHQNNKVTLLYGKNSIHLQPVSTDVISALVS